MLSKSLDSFDLTTAHTVLVLFGAALSLYVMQLTSHVEEDKVDPPWLQWGRRVCLAAIAWSLLWSLSYSTSKSWQPWPPEMALIFSLIAVLLIRVIAIHMRLRREKLHRHEPAPALHRDA